MTLALGAVVPAQASQRDHLAPGQARVCQVPSETLAARPIQERERRPLGARYPAQTSSVGLLLLRVDCGERGAALCHFPSDKPPPMRAAQAILGCLAREPSAGLEQQPSACIPR